MPWEASESQAPSFVGPKLALYRGRALESCRESALNPGTFFAEI